MKNTRKQNCLSGLSRFVSSSNRFVARHLDVDKFREDMRKISIVMIGAGAIGIVVDKIRGSEGLLLLIFGVIIWIIGLYQPAKGEET